MIRGADNEKIWFWHGALLFYWTALSFSRQPPRTNSHLVGRGSIDGRNGDVVQPEIHAQLGPVMNDVIHQ